MTDMYPLTDRRALVCGSTQGIGRACAEELARLGAQVTLLARNAETLAEVQQTLPAPTGAQHGHLRADFQDPEAVRDVVRAHVQSAGVVDILVNNTGGPPGGPITDAATAEFHQAITAHLFANHLLMQTVLPGMTERGFGRIVNIISTSVKQPVPGLGVSNTTRGAVASWAKTLSGEVAKHGITVNNVLPGFTWTQRLQSLIAVRAEEAGISFAEMKERWRATIPAGRFGEPAEVAAVVGFLATPAAGYVTGVSIQVDGGRTSCL